MFRRRVIIEREYSDTEVIEGLQNNNRDVARDFFRFCKSYYDSRHRSVMTVMTGARDNEDIFQESFMCLWNEIQKRRIFVRDNYAWRTDKTGTNRRMSASLYTYLMAIAKYKNHEVIREETIYGQENPNAHEPEPEDPEESEESTCEWIVRLCVNNLPPRCKDILRLFYFEGKSLDEILAIRGENQSKNGLKTGKSKCMKTLKDRIIEQFNRYNLKPYSHV